MPVATDLQTTRSRRRPQQAPGQPGQVGDARPAKHREQRRRRGDQGRQPECREHRMHQVSGADSERGAQSGTAAAAQGLGDDEQHVRAGRGDQRQHGGREEQQGGRVHGRSC